MNFTREPIIETIITPKEGYKLVVRNSKGGLQDEHSVDAVEVVSFGHSFFFRSLERPRPFLVPVSDYEILEVKETRVVLKNASVERAIKIGGGRDASMRPAREPLAEKVQEIANAEEEQPVSEEPAQEVGLDARLEKKRDRRRHRRRRGGEERYEGRDWADKPRTTEEAKKGEPSLLQPENGGGGGGANDEAIVSSSTFSTLFPPPPTLISETIGRYKDMALLEGNVFSKPVDMDRDDQESEPDASDCMDSGQDEHHDKDEKNSKEKEIEDEDSSGSEPMRFQGLTTHHSVSFEEQNFSSPSSNRTSHLFANDTYFLS